MAIRDIFKVSRKTFFNPSAWIDYNWLKGQTLLIYDTLKNLFTKSKPAHKESFEEAVKRLGLSPADIKSGIKTYRLYALLFLVFAILAAIYSFYLLFRYGTFFGWFLGMGMTGLLFAQAFKYDFWRYQMQHRKLGVTWKEWKNNMFSSKR